MTQNIARLCTENGPVSQLANSRSSVRTPTALWTIVSAFFERIPSDRLSYLQAYQSNDAAGSGRHRPEDAFRSATVFGTPIEGHQTDCHSSPGSHSATCYRGPP